MYTKTGETKKRRAPRDGAPGSASAQRRAAMRTNSARSRHISSVSPLQWSEPKPPKRGVVNRPSTPSAAILPQPIGSRLPVTRQLATSPRAASAASRRSTPGSSSRPRPARARCASKCSTIAALISGSRASAVSLGTPPQCISTLAAMRGSVPPWWGIMSMCASRPKHRLNAAEKASLWRRLACSPTLWMRVPSTSARVGCVCRCLRGDDEGAARAMMPAARSGGGPHWRSSGAQRRTAANSAKAAHSGKRGGRTVARCAALRATCVAPPLPQRAQSHRTTSYGRNSPKLTSVISRPDPSLPMVAAALAAATLLLLLLLPR